MAAYCRVALSLIVFTLSGQAFADFPYKEAYFDQYVDHFNLMSYGESTFKHRYLFQDEHWKQGGPIFFYAGNEKAIESFWNATGLVHEMAPQFQAYVVFAEHRYYGKSLPFGKDSYKIPYLGLLSIEQALADYAVLLTSLKEKLNATDSKVIAFGGSYGGKLAAYLRFKYPNIVDGALASSAPILNGDPSIAPEFFFHRVSADYLDDSKECFNLVKMGFKEMNDLASQGQSGLDKISTEFQLCDKLTNAASFRLLLGWARNAFVRMAMLDYPYPTSFTGHLPAWPVKVACGLITSASSPMNGIARASGIVYNNSVTCYDVKSEYVECADPTGCGTGDEATAWDYLVCTDIISPGGSNNVTDMFPVLPWNRQLRAEYCKKTYGITPRNNWPSIEFLGKKFQSSSNIIFSNGELDPWMGAGVNYNVSDTLIAIQISEAAHHLDLRASNQADPLSVISAREMEKRIIQTWIHSS